jgi:Holliday junction resolvase
LNSKQKGKRGELELCREFKDNGYNVRRSVQFNGKAEQGQADLIGLNGIHIECKRVEKLNIQNAIDQAKRDCSNEELPTIFHRKNNCEWLVTMRFEDWINLYREWNNGKFLNG